MQQVPGSTGAATLLAGTIAVADLVALLLILPVPALLTLAPLLVRGDRLDLGFVLIDTPSEAWLAAAWGAALSSAVLFGARKVVRLQRTWIERQIRQPVPWRDIVEEQLAHGRAIIDVDASATSSPCWLR